MTCIEFAAMMGVFDSTSAEVKVTAISNGGEIGPDGETSATTKILPPNLLRIKSCLLFDARGVVTSLALDLRAENIVSTEILPDETPGTGELGWTRLVIPRNGWGWKKL